MAAVEDVFCSDRCRLCGDAAGPVCLSCVPSLRRAPGPVVAEENGRILTALAYEGAARGLVLTLKLGGRRSAAGPLVAAMADLAHRAGLRAELVTWVPGRRKDIRHRGFDHAEVLAQGLAVRLGLPCRSLLKRAGPRMDQAGLGRGDRWTNAAGAFISRPCDGWIVVVDDLVTSGATADAASAALLGAGATGVEILAACRAEMGLGRDVAGGASLSEAPT